MWNVTPKREMKDMCGVAGLGWCWWLDSCFVMNWVTQTQLSSQSIMSNYSEPRPVPVIYIQIKHYPRRLLGQFKQFQPHIYIYPTSLHLHISV